MEHISVGKIASRLALLCVAALPACSVTPQPESPRPEAAREASFEAGVAALDRGDHAAAAARLAPVAAICPVDATGRRAVLLLAAAELDPRNGAGRPNAAAELAAFYLGRAYDDSWERALAVELYTLALDYGAQPVDGRAIPGAGIIWAHYLGNAAGEAPLGVSADSAVGGAPVAALTDAEPTSAPAEPEPVAAPGEGGPRCDVPAADERLVLPTLTREPIVARGDAAAPAADDAAPIASGDVRALNAEIDRLRAELARRDQELERIRRTLRP